MAKSRLGLALGGLTALLVAAGMVSSCRTSMENGVKWCNEHCADDAEALRYCLAQNNQAPAWALGFGFWYACGAFAIGYGVGWLIDNSDKR